QDPRVSARLQSTRRMAAARPMAAGRPVFSPSGGFNLFRKGLAMEAAGALPRLDYTRDRAGALASGLPQADGLRARAVDASRAAALSPQLAECRTIVFATDGLLNTEYPELSGVALSMIDERGEPQDGFLRLQHVYSLQLNAALVVLGGCETGLGREI